MTYTKKSAPTLSEFFQPLTDAFPKAGSSTGFIILVCALLALSVLAGLRTAEPSKMLVAGDVASQDIVASRDLWIEDTKATEAQRNALVELSPAVFDLTFDPVRSFRENISRTLTVLSSAPPDMPTDKLAKELATEIGVPISLDSVQAMRRPDVHDFITDIGLPWISDQLASGVIADAGQLHSKGGVLVRNPSSDMETLRRDPEYIVDLPILLTQSSQLMFNQANIPPSARQAVDKFLSSIIKPTLVFNREATFDISESMLRTVKPVFYNIHKGDVIVYKGEQITPEIQLKLQALFDETSNQLPLRTVFGVFLLSVILSMGLLVTPSGNSSSPLKSKDYIVIAVTLLVIGLLAKSTYLLGQRLLDPRLIAILAYGFPVAGFSGLFALIFGARRYWTIALLIAMFSTLCFKETLPVFLCFFFSALFNTAMTLRAQTRQDIVRNTIPLFIGLLLISFSCVLIQDLRDLESYLWLTLTIFINSMLSVFLMFAFSPLLETSLHYSTRFRFMELMNMEQPLLQELMVTVPGTYHHSLVVSNMAEAGAKAIGANSLLCKVAALYHDVGKLARPEYFIENQFEGPNKHDALSPSMSALILASHVKKGTEFARKFHLGDDITNIIQQHHGTSIMQFFFNKAKSLGENPKIEDFSYPGPRPQTKEAAIVMLADVVEASSRALADPTPARLTAHVNNIIKSVYSSGQLDESELTLKDLNVLGENYIRILTGIFHHRIAYPGGNAQTEPTAAPVKTDSGKKESCTNHTSTNPENEYHSPKSTSETTTRAGSSSGNISGEPAHV